jgi:hypothetical protein
LLIVVILAVVGCQTWLGVKRFGQEHRLVLVFVRVTRPNGKFKGLTMAHKMRLCLVPRPKAELGENVSRLTAYALALLLSISSAAIPLAADAIYFSTGEPDGKIATLSRPASLGQAETETADDFLLDQASVIQQATFTGLLPTGTPLGSITSVEVEIYRVFPQDSASPPDDRVVTRVNSPSDIEFADTVLTYTTALLNPSFTVSNTVVNGINPKPTQFTGGEGSSTGEEVLFSIDFTSLLALDAGHYFFRPEVALSNGNFLWLSAPRPIVDPGTPFANDLQSWIRDTGLDPDWERIGTDITHQGTFNAAFSLTGTTAAVPEPGTCALLGVGLCLLGIVRRRKRHRDG